MTSVSRNSASEADGMSDFRIAVIGQGLIGRQRATALESIAGATLAATVDPQPGGPTAAAGAPHYAYLTELPPSAYDAAIVAVPHDLASRIADEILRAGKPVLVEKPLGTSAAGARALEQLALTVPTPSFVGYNYRFLPAVRQLMEAVKDGRLGRLRSIDMLIGHGGHPGSADGWKLDPARAGGGVLLDPGVHLLDLVLRIAPDAVFTAIEATRGFWPTGIEEDVVLTFRADDLIGSVRISHIRWINTLRIEAFGENGYAIAEGRGGNYGAMTLRTGERWGWTRVAGASQRETETVHDFGVRNNSLRDELEAVIRAWTGDRLSEEPHPATMSEAREVTELCESLYARTARAGELAS
jgi:1,5-anhydro-D-fructose reductase (1,5-anhydro-D-mannitol-forming)